MHFLQPTRNTDIVFTKAETPRNDWLEKVVGPFEIQYAEEEMHRHEKHGPMPENARSGDLFIRHAAKCVHDERINENADNYPRQVK